MAKRDTVRDKLGADKTVPDNAADMKAKLSPEFVAILDDPKYHQKMQDFTYDYPEVGQCDGKFDLSTNNDFTVHVQCFKSIHFSKT